MLGWESWWGSIIVSIIAPASIILLLITLIMFLRCFTARHDLHSRPESPLDILKKRYARGDITAEEYEHMKHFLES